MIIIPAIDIRMGKVVRLLQGDFANETVYSGDPVNMAIRWEKEGAKMLHVVDLDGALSGTLKNFQIIKQMATCVKIPIELGGGLRSEKEVDEALSCGVSRVVIGTMAYKDEGFLKKLLKKNNDAIAISVDVNEDKIAAEGWQRKIPVSVKDFIKRVTSLGVKTIIYTDISKDGMMSGVDLTKIKKMLDYASCDVIISGGISSLGDIKAIKDLNRKNISGIIIGKALYEMEFTLKEANEAIQ